MELKAFNILIIDENFHTGDPATPRGQIVGPCVRLCSWLNLGTSICGCTEDHAG